jgi:ribosomal protein S6--L-glutamate ligase
MKIGILTWAKDHFRLESIDRLIEEATPKGHNIERIRYSECSLLVENGRPAVLYRGETLDLDAVIPWVIQGYFDYGMSVLRQFEAMKLPCLNGSRAFEDSVYKWNTAQVLSQNGIPVPDTYYANHPDQMGSLIERVKTEQVVLKIQDGTKGKGVTLADTKKSAKDMSAELSLAGENYIAQEFIAESKGADIRAYVVGDEVVAAMERRAQNGGFLSNMHQGASAAAIQLSDEERALAVKAAEVLGLNCCGVDIMRSNKGPLVIEANASAGFAIEKITDVNVAKKIIEFIEKLSEKSR